VAREHGKILAIPPEELKEVVAEEPDLSDIILKALLARRSRGMRTGLGLRIVGSRHSRCDGPEGVRGPQPAAPRCGPWPWCVGLRASEGLSTLVLESMTLGGQRALAPA
jgi:thioredoxin reductase (NADPH)